MGLTPNTEPRSAAEYDDRSKAAVRSVLVEIGQVLGAFQGKFAVVGGAVPWLLLDNDDMRHVGTIDVDLTLDAEGLRESEYVDLVEALLASGYEQKGERKKFQLVRTVEIDDGGAPIDIYVDFLMPRNVKLEAHEPPFLDDFAVQRADAADLALKFADMIAIEGAMPRGGVNRVEIAIASIPALLAMKGYAVGKRDKPKDAYDIYYCVRNYPDGIQALAAHCLPLLAEKTGAQGFQYIAEKFRSFDDFGPTSVKAFVAGTPLLAGRTEDQWQQDAFGQVDAFIKALAEASKAEGG